MNSVIGERIKSVRLKKRLSASGTAKKVGISAYQYKKIESGIFEDKEIFVKIAKVLNVSVAFLLTGVKTNEQDYFIF